MKRGARDGDRAASAPTLRRRAYGGRRDLEVGNTEVLAGMIAARLRCDVHEIEAAKPYAMSGLGTTAEDYRESCAGATRRRTGPSSPDTR